MKVYITLIEWYTNLEKKANIICPHIWASGMYVPQKELIIEIVSSNPNLTVPIPFSEVQRLHHINLDIFDERPE